jgi:hypothetical protein
LTFLRRLVRRVPAVSASSALLALDIGTEYAKALVFETSEGEGAVVTGVGSRRQGLSHMQSGTVADIPAVVANCRAALDGPAWRGVTSCGRHRRRAVGLHHDAQPRALSRTPSRTELERCSRAGGGRLGRGPTHHHLGDGPPNVMCGRPCLVAALA